MPVTAKVRDAVNPNPVYAAPDATVESVARLMAETNCDAIPICKEGKVVGIITERDVTRRIIAHGLNPAQTMVRDVMTLMPAEVCAD